MGYGYCGPGFAGSAYPRRYISRQERIDWLKEYQDALQKETQAVKERIEELEKEA